MKTSKRDKEEILKGILKGFFDRNTISKFIKSLPVDAQTKRNPKISTKTIDLIGGKMVNPVQSGLLLDFIITKAEAALTEKKLLSLLLKLGNYSIASGEFASAVYIFEKLASITSGGNTANQITADSFLSLADIFSRQALWGISSNYINEAYNIYRKLKNNKGCADCENILGSIQGELGNLKQAQTHFENALSLIKNKKDTGTKGKIEINLGIINNILGNYDSALKYYKNALVKFSSIKDYKKIADIDHNIGMLHSKMHKYRLAIKEFDKSIHLSYKKRYLPTLGISYLGKAAVYAIKEDYKLSSFFAEKALQVCHKINDRLSIADIYKVKGIIHRDTKNYKLAEDYLATSLRINTELDNEMNKAETEFELGLLYKRMNKKSESRSFFMRSKQYFRKIGALKEVKEIDRLLK
jgi:tetratricopeptide (TPR) repeat protein